MQSTARKLTVTTPWLSSARNDLAFFFAPAFAAICLTGLFRHDAVVNSPLLLFLILQGFALGPFHQGLTWFQFFDQNNLKQYGASKNFFWAFGAPLLLIALSIAAYWMSPPLLIFVYIAWTIQHIAKQNVGILLLYHNHDRSEAIVPREIETRTVETTAALFSFLFLNSFVAQSGWIAIALHLLIVVLSIESIWLLVRFSTSLWRQVRLEGKSLNAPALVFWMISCLAFIPFALAKDYGQGLFVALVMHWFQYLGLNAILVRRKYATEASKRVLIGNQPALLFLAVGLLFALVSMPIQLFAIKGVNPNDYPLRILIGLVYGLTLSHYFLDAFIWRFREPFNRASILSYLKPRANLPSTLDAPYVPSDSCAAEPQLV